MFLEVLSACSPQHVRVLRQVSGCCAGRWDGVAGTPPASVPPASVAQVSARLRACLQPTALTGHAAPQSHNLCKVVT